jgi:hypothetical protein
MGSLSNGPEEGQVTAPPASDVRIVPASLVEAERKLAELDALLSPPKPPSDGDDDGDREPPTSRTPSPKLSHLAIRDDGLFMVTLDDAEDRDLSGREVIRCIALRVDQVALARSETNSAFAAIASQIIGSLPKRAP